MKTSTRYVPLLVAVVLGAFVGCTREQKQEEEQMPPRCIPRVEAGGAHSIPRVEAGGAHSLMLSEGSIWAWGDNSSGQLGDGTTANRSTPVRVEGLSDVVAVDAGERHSVAVLKDGSVWVWGDNASGQLGDGTTANRSTPVRVEGLSDVVAVSAGGLASLALRRDGTVWSLGRTDIITPGTPVLPKQVDGLSDVVAISAGNLHFLVVRQDGTAWAWGYNDNGRIGDGTTASRSTPVQVLTEVAEVSAGYDHSLAVRKDGTVWAWGGNGSGQLGDGTTTQRMTPAQVQLQGPCDAAAVSAGGTYGQGNGYVSFGGMYSVAVLKDGTVWAWGANSSGQLGDGTTTQRMTPVRVPGLANVTRISAGHHHALAARDDGTVWAWGYRGAGQLGDGTVIRQMSPLPVRTAGLTDAVSISAGWDHDLAVRADGTLWAWGANDYGQLGLGTRSLGEAAPVQVAGMEGVKRVSAGFDYSLAVREDGTAWAWGWNKFFRLGRGYPQTSPSHLTPGRVLKLPGATAVAANSVHSLALSEDGTVWIWGGDATTSNGNGILIWYEPVQMLTGAVEVVAGPVHSLAWRSDGTVMAWGENRQGQLGDGTTTNRAGPVQVLGLSDVVAVAAGSSHSLALSRDGTVWAWGANSSGQLGDGTTTQRLTPVRVANLSGVTKLAGGSIHSLALSRDGTVWAWGSGDRGRLGDGLADHRANPEQVTLP